MYTETTSVNIILLNVRAAVREKTNSDIQAFCKFGHVRSVIDVIFEFANINFLCPPFDIVKLVISNTTLSVINI
jgi:hypothetical protein